MFVAPLGSGSAGNAYYLESDGTRILVDAGFGPREMAKRLAEVGRPFDGLQAIVITHEHYDHIRGAGSISRKLGIPIFLTAGTLRNSNLDPAETNTVIFENNSSFRIGDLNIHARRTIHDAADSACYVIEAGDGTRVGIASDLGHADEPVVRHLSKCDALYFESNHDVDMLRLGTYPWSLKRRILSRFGHLSNEESMLALKKMIGPELKTLCLIHLSEKNNHESIVRAMASDLIAEVGARLELQIAKQAQPLGVLELARRGAAARRPPSPVHSQMALFAV
jgi:phosphoribosyl 1,2-cyclic phosphodiesterase